MGTIAYIDRKLTEQYNKINISKGDGNISAAGWGVRERSQPVGFTGDSVICNAHQPRANSNIKYVKFRVLTPSGTPDTDYVVFSIWKKSSTALFFTKVYRYVINKSVLEDNYGAGTTFAATTEYTIELPEAVHLTPIADVTYYIGIFASGCELDYDTTGTTDGAYYEAGADISLNDTFAVAAFDALNAYAISLEAFTEPDRWDQVLDGGAISLENTDWHNALYATGTWPNIPNIYGAGLAVSPNNGEYILIDLGAGLVPVTPWGGAAAGIGAGSFPDYTVYGVRALQELIITWALAAGTEYIDILVSDEDDASAPSYGYQLIQRIDNTMVSSMRISLPAIARWIKLVHSGAGAANATIDDFDVWQISYGITDGDFPVDVLTAGHHIWIENYPTEIAIYKSRLGNMAGSSSAYGKPFTNRENVD